MKILSLIELVSSEYDEDDNGDDTADGKDTDMDVEKRAGLNDRT